MLYALDTEFCENGKTIELISVALVAEDGRTFYVQVCETPIDEDRREFYGLTAPLAHEWVRQHVVPHLDHRNCLTPCEASACPWRHKSDVPDAILGFLHDASPVFVGYYSAYDWVALCQLFGTMMDLPQGWPMYCRDLRQLLDYAGLQHVRQPDEMPHHALSDAQWIMETYKRYSTRFTGSAL